jgi:hypothetical protein
MPKSGPTLFEDLNREGSSIALAKVRATMTPTPGVVISNRVRTSDRAIASRRFSRPSNSRWSVLRTDSSASAIFSRLGCHGDQFPDTPFEKTG